MEEILFICQCGDVEHQLIMGYDSDEKSEYNVVYCSVHLNPERSIWKRIVSAIKYIFGYRCKYGHFDEFIFRPSDCDKLQKVVDRLRNVK